MNSLTTSLRLHSTQTNRVWLDTLTLRLSDVMLQAMGEKNWIWQP